MLIGSDGRYQRMDRRHRETMRLPFPDGHVGEEGQLGHVYLLDGKALMAREEMPSYRAAQGEEFDDYTYWVGDDDPRTRAASPRRLVRCGPDGERLGAELAYLEMLCEHEELPPDVTAKLRVVQRNALRLRTLLSDLLHVGQVGEDSLQLQRAPVDLAALVHEAVEASRPFAEKWPPTTVR